MLAFPIFLGRSRIVLPKKHSGGVFPAESKDAQKKNQTEVWFLLMLALPIFLGRPRIVLPKKHSGGVFPAESVYA